MANVFSNIIFRIMTPGAQKAALKFAAMGVAMGAVLMGFNKLRKSAEKFQQVFAKLDIDMTLFNKNTAGLVDTFESYQGAMKLQNRELGVNAKQMEAVGKVAVHLNQSLGNGPEGTTKTYNDLINSIVKGNEKALIPLGLTLSQTTDKTLASKEALALVTEYAEGLTVAATNTTEKVFALQNSLGTITDLQTHAYLNELSLGFYNVVGSIMGGSDAVTDFESAMIDTNGEIGAWAISMDGMITGIDMAVSSLFGFEEGIDRATHSMQSQLDEMKRYQDNLRAIRELQKEIANSRESVTAVEQVSALGAEIGKLAEAGKQAELVETYKRIRQIAASGNEDAKQAAKIVLDTYKGSVMVAEEILKLEDEAERKRLLRKTGLGKKAKGAGKVAEDRFDTLRTVEISEIQEPSVSIKERLELDQAELIDAVYDFENQKIDIATASAAQRRQIWAMEFEEQERLAALEAERLEYIATLKDDQVARDVTRFEEMLGIEQSYLDRSQELWDSSAAAKVSMVSNAMQQQMSLIGKFAVFEKGETKKSFKRKQNFEYAANLVNTPLMATNSFKAMSGIPVVGPILGAAAAATATAYGVKMGKEIRSARFDGETASGGGGGGIPAISSGGFGGDNGVTPQGEGDTLTTTVLLDSGTLLSATMAANDVRNNQGQEAFIKTSQ